VGGTGVKPGLAQGEDFGAMASPAPHFLSFLSSPYPLCMGCQLLQFCMTITECNNNLGPEGPWPPPSRTGIHTYPIHPSRSFISDVAGAEFGDFSGFSALVIIPRGRQRHIMVMLGFPVLGQRATQLSQVSSGCLIGP
jgi:hypothetical protein